MNRQVVYLEEITYQDVEKLDRGRTIVLLPMGPLEAHGPHLPLGVDIYGAEKLTELASQMLSDKGYEIAVAPLMPYTLADVAMPFCGTISLSRDTVVSFVLDVTRSLYRHGFTKLAIVCHHGERPNLAALQQGAELAEKLGMKVLVSHSIIHAAPKMMPLMQGEHPEWDFHAGEIETSFSLWTFPDLVKLNILHDLPPNWSNIREKFNQGARDFAQAGGESGYFGDPAKATSELGEKLYMIQAQTLCEEVEQWVMSLY